MYIKHIRRLHSVAFIMKHPAVASILLLFVLAFSAVAANATPPKSFKGVTASLTVHASPEHVWRAIRALRDDDPDGVKTISQTANEDILEEVFDELPLIGEARCRYKETYKPFQRIDYQMISSDHFKAFEGSWVLTPAAGGHQTIVELSSYIDTGLCVPFAHQLTNVATARNVHRRLEEVKKAVESHASKSG